MSESLLRRNLLRFYNALHQLLTDERPYEEGQMIDDIRRLCIIDSIGLDSMDNAVPAITLMFRRRTVRDEQLVMKVYAADPLDREMTDRQIAHAAWQTAVPPDGGWALREANSTGESVTRSRG